MCKISIKNISLDVDWKGNQGFGQLYLFKDQLTNQVKVANEFLNRTTVKNILYAMVDDIIQNSVFLDEDIDDE